MIPLASFRLEFSTEYTVGLIERPMFFSTVESRERISSSVASQQPLDQHHSVPFFLARDGPVHNATKIPSLKDAMLIGKDAKEPIVLFTRACISRIMGACRFA